MHHDALPEPAAVSQNRTLIICNGICSLTRHEKILQKEIYNERFDAGSYFDGSGLYARYAAVTQAQTQGVTALMFNAEWLA
jgi:hypothetical protein